MQDMPDIEQPSVHDLSGAQSYLSKDVDCVDLVVRPDSRPDSLVASSQLSRWVEGLQLSTLPWGSHVLRPCIYAASTSSMHCLMPAL